MKILERAEAEPLANKNQDFIQMPFGLLGLEENKKYLLLASPEEAPFLWLQMAEEPNISFLVVSPFVVMPTYQPELSADDVEFLGLKKPEDAMIFNIVTLRGSQGPTANLKGPIVVNRLNLRAKQIIPVNAANYSVQQAFPNLS
jgi:flagellar assembly factor FliW